jgi:excisionase family DNA binding protein
MAQQIITTTYEPTEFKLLLADIIRGTVQSEIALLISPTEPQKEILTRQETAKLLDISLTTLNDYTKREFIVAHRLGYKVRYKRQEVEKALVKMDLGKKGAKAA